MLIRDRPTRAAPRTTKRPHLSYKTRSSPEPGTRRVTRTIVLPQLAPAATI
ncbi:hypothetical protein [Streptomyces sp. NBC_00316]|uniref:hypothetical protein n=1 Tax=Streptomyces sp. NBC_00316 TaxID=2975710 RepID=UPI002E2A8684|nr:hypothetical protein [Streptomyces sp. NBC_00316]